MDDVMQLVRFVFVVRFVGRRALVEGSAAETRAVELAGLGRSREGC